MNKPVPGQQFRNPQGIEGVVNKFVFNPAAPETEIEVLYPNGALETYACMDLTFKRNRWQMKGERYANHK